MASQIVVLLVLARFLGPADFGVASLALVIIGFSEIFTQLGVGPALVQRRILTRAHIATSRTLALATGLLFGAALWVAAPFLERYFDAAGLKSLLQALSPVFIIQGFSVASESLLQRGLKFRTIAKITAAGQLFGYAGVSILCAYLGLGAWSIIIAHLAKTIIRSALMLAFSEAGGLAFHKNAAKELLNFGAGFSIAKIFNFLALQGDNLLVAKLLGPTALGYYGRAYYFVEASASFVGNSIDQVLFPALASVQSDRLRAARAYRRVIMLVMAIFVPGSLFIAVHADLVVRVLLGEDWTPVVLPLRILAIGIAMRAGYRVSDSLTRAMGAVYRRAWRQAIYACLVFLGAWAGHFFGIAGVAAGISAALVVNYLLMLQLGRSLVEARWTFLISAHAPGLVLGILTLATGIPVARALHDGSLPPLLSLVTAIFAFAVTVSVAAGVGVRLLSTEDRGWLQDVAGSKLRRFSLRKKGSAR